MPGDQQEVKINIQPPRSSASRAGRYEITILVSSKADPTQIAEAKTTLTVSPFSQFSSELRPQRIRAGQPANVVVNNLGNLQETFRLTLKDRGDELAFEPAETQLNVAEAKSGAVEFRVVPRKQRWFGGEKVHAMTAQVSRPKGDPQVHPGEVVSRALLPSWTLMIILILCILLGLGVTGVFGAVARNAQAQTATVEASANSNLAVTATAEWLAGDDDRDGLTNGTELNELGTLPGMRDTDGDGLDDGQEVNTYATSPLNADTDGEGLNDGDEVSKGLDPKNRDTDGDGFLDNVDPDPSSLPTLTPSAVPTTAIPSTMPAPTTIVAPTTAIPPTTPPSTIQPPIPREEYVDSNTQEQGMHACPKGFAIGGVHVGNNLLLCRRVMFPGEEMYVGTILSNPDNQKVRANMHACPEGMYMRGLHVGNNWLLCSYDGRSQPPNEVITEFEDTSSQAHDMHVCFQTPENISFLTGIHVGENRFLCGLHQE
jgi:hypothetical protein